MTRHQPKEVNAMTSEPVVLAPKWYTTAQVAELLGFGLYKTKMIIATGELRSLKDGKYRRILPEWVDEYVARRAQEYER
jgi:excisionase family DNA binding protein